MSTKPKIFIFCNGCSAHDWHQATALSEDGHFLAGHVCSHHGFIPHDMGLTSTWKHGVYQEHYPDGFEVVLVDKDAEDIKKHEGIKAAYAAHLALRSEPEAEGKRSNPDELHETD